MFTNKKIAIVSVINDLVTDARVNKTCLVLQECGFNVVLIGRELPHSLPVPNWPFKSIRMRLLFKKGPLFYFFFNLRLFFRLLFLKSDLVYANDLDTLLPNYLISKIKRIPLIYDSHELFCEVPELQNSYLKRKLWLVLERKIVSKLKYAVTVNESIADVLFTQYHVPFTVVRNIAQVDLEFKPKTRSELNLPLNKKIVLLQGAGINIDRGAEELIEAMRYVNGVLLLIIGSGDVWEILKQKITEFNLNEKVQLIEKLPKSQLMHYTYNADLGLSIDKNTNLNYFFSLPNKIFDYIHAGVPILASRLPEIEKVITQYAIGSFIENHEPAHIAEKINALLNSENYQDYKKNTRKAKLDLNWDTEKQKLMSLLLSVKT